MLTSIRAATLALCATSLLLATAPAAAGALEEGKDFRDSGSGACHNSTVKP